MSFDIGVIVYNINSAAGTFLNKGSDKMKNQSGDSRQLELRFDKFKFKVTFAEVERFILDELKNLSEYTGLSIDCIEIKFDTSCAGKTVAYFGYDSTHREFCFHLSQFAGASPGKIADTVRHEFAHFMVNASGVTESDAHGEMWKAACEIVNAVPSPYFSTTPTTHIKK